jgi:hypothetical protein
LLEIIGKRQVSGEARDPVVFDDHGAVVAGRMWIKDTFQQRLADFAAQFDSAHDVAIDGIVPLDDHQRADFFLGQISEGADQNIHSVRAQRPGWLRR